MAVMWEPLADKLLLCCQQLGPRPLRHGAAPGHRVVRSSLLHMARVPSRCPGHGACAACMLYVPACRAMRRSESMHRRMVDLVAAAKMRTQTNTKRHELVGIR